MKTIILLDTSVGTTNKGDDIIMDSTRKGLENILRYNYVICFPTHTVCFTWFQTHFWWKAKFVEQADYKFVCGTNLLAKNMRYPINDWNINIFNCKPLRNTILVGVGNSKLDKSSNFYTRMLYKKVLSKDYIHSTRDDETRLMLKQLGYKAITTGCPTLWSLTASLCAEIPVHKSNSVVLAITGSDRNVVQDQKMIDICQRNYKKIYLWLQTVHDLSYLKILENTGNIQIIPPDIEEYAKLLESMDIDYVGTRLHGGIFAMQHKKRAIIVSIDNRARNINKVNKLNCIERENSNQLEAMINSEFETRVEVDYEKINEWKSQFI